jgi:hypothetical protein
MEMCVGANRVAVDVCIVVERLLSGGWVYVSGNSFDVTFEWFSNICAELDPGECLELKVFSFRDYRYSLLFIRKSQSLQTKLGMSSDVFKNLYRVRVVTKSNSIEVNLVVAQDDKDVKDFLQETCRKLANALERDRVVKNLPSI